MCGAPFHWAVQLSEQQRVMNTQLSQLCTFTSMKEIQRALDSVQEQCLLREVVDQATILSTELDLCTDYLSLIHQLFCPLL